MVNEAREDGSPHHACQPVLAFLLPTA